MKSKNINSILFVCLGNICRSPIAEGVARELNKKYNLNLHIDSAGTGSWHIDSPPCPNSVQVAKEFGVDISDLRARVVKKDDFERFCMIVAMDDSNISNLKLLSSAHHKIHKLGNFGRSGQDVPDPYFFKEYDGFKEVYKMIHECVESLFEEIR